MYDTMYDEIKYTIQYANSKCHLTLHRIFFQKYFKSASKRLIFLNYCIFKLNNQYLVFLHNSSKAYAIWFLFSKLLFINLSSIFLLFTKISIELFFETFKLKYVLHKFKHS